MEMISPFKVVSGFSAKERTRAGSDLRGHSSIPTVRDFYIAGIPVFMNFECLEYNETGIQADICDCGIVGCNPGNWIMLRQLEHHVFLLPCFDEMNVTDFDLIESRPPNYLRSTAAMVLNSSDFEELRKEIHQLPPLGSLQRLKAWELLKALQWAVPQLQFGDVGSFPILDQAVFLAVSDGELSQELSCLEELIKGCATDHRYACSLEVERTVEFHLDLPGFPVWRGFGYRKGKPVLVVS